MTLWEFMLSWEMVPFSAAFALLLLFLLLEVLTLLFGSSLFGLGGDADLDAPDIDASAPDAPDLDAPGVDAGGDAAAAPGGALLAWLGLGEAPFMVWLVALLTGFGITGYAGQLLGQEILGAPFSPWLAAAVALPVGLMVARRFSRAMANLLPRVQTEAVSEGRLGGRVGLVTVGTARAGRPAEAKVTDHFGNTHYIRVVPLKAGDELPAGTEIAVLRGKNRIYRAMRLNK